MVRVKICGLARRADIDFAVNAGADALGFIAVEQSPRHVAPDTVGGAIADLPPFVTTVVVAKAPTDAVPYPVRVAQVYATPDPGFCKPFVRVFRIGSADDLPAALAHSGPILLDAYSRDALGGTGTTFDWALARAAVEQHRWPVILAGGLTPENVGDAVKRVRPYAVDVSSGVESAPGVKDPERVRRFIDTVRGCV